MLPAGWEDRLVKIQSSSTDLKIGWCLDSHDLAASKLAAGREKDREFIAAVLHHGLVDPRVVAERIDQMPLTPEHRQRMSMMLLRIDREVNESWQANRDGGGETEPDEQDGIGRPGGG